MKKSQTGFTLVELLVVIAIIGLLIGMLLPAVQMVREAARRSQCANNVRQMALGLHNFHSVYSRFPSGWKGNLSETEVGWGWMAQTLPFVEQQNLYAQINLNRNLMEGANRGLIDEKVPGQLCPSSANHEATFLIESDPSSSAASSGSSQDAEVGRTHYVACIGSIVPTMEMEDGQTCPSHNLLDNTSYLNGMFFRNSRTRIADVIDGTSNTIMMGERSSELFDSNWAGVITGAKHTGWRVVGWTGEPPNNPLRLVPEVIVDEVGDEEELEIHFHGFAQYNSQHAGGICNFGMVDGSVRSIGEDIDPKAFRAMGTFEGGEIFSLMQ